MDQPTSDLEGVAVYLDILVSGATADEQLQNLYVVYCSYRKKAYYTLESEVVFIRPKIDRVPGPHDVT